MASAKRKRTITPADLEAARNLRRIWDHEQRRRKFKQDDVAEMFGWSSQGSVSQYLNGKLALGVAATLKFARYLNCRPTDIRPDYESQLASGLTQEAVELAFMWQEIPDANSRTYFQKLIAGWTDRQTG